jgi:hypothetical protein
LVPYFSKEPKCTKLLRRCGLLLELLELDELELDDDDDDEDRDAFTDLSPSSGWSCAVWSPWELMGDQCGIHGGLMAI